MVSERVVYCNLVLWYTMLEERVSIFPQKQRLLGEVLIFLDAFLTILWHNPFCMHPTHGTAVMEA